MSKQGYSKIKGREGENAVVDYLRLRGIPAERRRLTGASDCGDIGAWKDVVVEVKSEKRLNLAGYMDELAEEVGNASMRFGGDPIGFAVCKRRGSQDPATWYAILPLSEMVRVLQKGGYAP